MRSLVFTGIAGLACMLASSPVLHAQCVGSGSTTTLFAGGNGQAGNMFDIVVGGADMTLDCLDLNLSVAGAGYDIEVYYCNGTSVGNESNAAAWTLITTVTNVTGAGPGVATNVDLGGTSPTFAAGQTYGIYVQNANYPTPGYLQYTNGGPNTYNGTHCDVVTNCGKAINFGSTFYPREFNGTVHTSTGAPAGPTLTISGSCPGVVDLDLTNMSPDRVTAIGWSLGSGTSTLDKGSCAGLLLGLPAPAQFGGVVKADANGEASFQFDIPAAACGNISFQALDIRTCTLTNVASI